MTHRTLRRPGVALALLCAALLPACDNPTEVESPVDDTTTNTELDAASLRYLQGWRGERSSADIVAFPDGTEPFGRSVLVRHPRSVSFVIKTSGLSAGHAYSVWMVVFNNPAGCATNDEGEAGDGPTICDDFDLFNPDAEPDLVYATGRIVRRSGHTVFAGHRRVGDTRGSVNEPVGLPAFGLTDPENADIRFVIHDHGPFVRGFWPDMVMSIDGGCTDAGVPFAGFDSPWNGYDGPRRLPAYGRRGPNECASVQVAAHIPGL